MTTPPLSGTPSSTQRPAPPWVVRSRLLWQHRMLLCKATVLAVCLNTVIVYCIPNSYKSTTSIMPPDQQGSGAMMLAALAQRASGLGALGGLAGGLLSAHTPTALFIDLLHSGTVTGHLIERFELKKVYHDRYNTEAGKHLARNTSIKDDKKSGVITIEVIDKDPQRARDLAQGYLDELNSLLTKTSTSSAHQERVFIETRLSSVRSDLERAQLDLSEFSSRNSTVDIKEQTRAMVDAGAKVQAQLVVEQAGLDSLRRIYGDGNMRVQESEARIATLQHELVKLTGTSSPLKGSDGNPLKQVSDSKDELYPPLRQLPRLAVPYADLYRNVRVQEAVFELLTQQYELARIQEAKDIPVVSVIDPPGIPERKYFPRRKTLIVILTFLCFLFTGAFILLRDAWHGVAGDDPAKVLIRDILATRWKRPASSASAGAP